ncbi:MAG TPA: HAMP domain-containing histidine kinase [Deltaproteobacteria bacterium]|nr:HAMP domain-containing histidine kinase [Deltaproteobacteria bacterium]
MWRPTDPPWRLQNTPGEGALWLSWLVRLRWVALFAQAVTLAFVFKMLHGVGVIAAWFTIMAALGVANAWAVRQLEHGTPNAILAHLLLDVIALTVFFTIGGGPDNPFTPLYLIHIAMAAVMLPPGHSGLLAASVLACYSMLFAFHLPLHYERHSLPEGVLLRFGQWIAFMITSVSIAAFVVGIAATLRRRKEQLLEARDRTARTDRLRSVGTLAAGAAHELNTPLSTISLRIRRVGRRHDDADTSRDVEVMRAQLERCTSIVRRLLVGAGDPDAADIERRPLATLVEEAVRMWSRGATLDVKIDDTSHGVVVELPRIAFQQALINLLENAREAQEAASAFEPLELRILHELDLAVVEVADRGCGLPPEADQVGEPFFTTKPTGTGLGVFVARQVADGAGGGLQLLPRARGTVARWWFPEVPRRSA